MTDQGVPIEVQTAATLATVERFNATFNNHDVAAVMVEMTEDCVFENTCPPPDGERSVGRETVRGVDVFRVRAGKVAEKLSFVKG